MGARQSEEERKAGLSFVIGTEKVHVVILKAQDLAQRNSIIDTMLNLPSLRSTYQLLYLAVPRLLGATIDSATFRSHGIGLLLFDERRIDEAVTPQTARPGIVEMTTRTQEATIAAELATLKSMYSQMEKDFAQLREDLRRMSASEIGSERVPTSLVAPQEPAFAHSVGERMGLPSYFSNNPWLDVLSKRGRTENDLIAG